MRRCGRALFRVFVSHHGEQGATGVWVSSFYLHEWLCACVVPGARVVCVQTRRAVSRFSRGPRFARARNRRLSDSSDEKNMPSVTKKEKSRLSRADYFIVSLRFESDSYLPDATPVLGSTSSAVLARSSTRAKLYNSQINKRFRRACRPISRLNPRYLEDIGALEHRLDLAPCFTTPYKGPLHASSFSSVYCTKDVIRTAVTLVICEREGCIFLSLLSHSCDTSCTVTPCKYNLLG